MAGPLSCGGRAVAFDESGQFAQLAGLDDPAAAPLRRYAQFRGRSGRREFWFFSLLLAIGYLVIFAVAVGAGLAGEASVGDDGVVYAMLGGWTLLFAATFIPGLALTTRRFHDMGLSGAMLIVVFGALVFLNALGWLGYLVWMSIPGQRSENRHGPPVDQRDVAEVFR
jgi:uncharacterized membrane protein YhaH (DUF805 family)